MVPPERFCVRGLPSYIWEISKSLDYEVISTILQIIVPVRPCRGGFIFCLPVWNIWDDISLFVLRTTQRNPRPPLCKVWILITRPGISPISSSDGQNSPRVSSFPETSSGLDITFVGTMNPVCRPSGIQEPLRPQLFLYVPP